jgi:hypothetical protein
MARRLTALLASIALVLLIAPTALAAAPPNDSMTTPTVIESIPARVTVDTTEATTSAGDPDYCFGGGFGPDAATVWFSYTAAATGPLGATTFGSDYDTTLYVGTLSGDSFHQIACGDDSATVDSAVRFEATAGVTYVFAVGTSPFAGVNGGSLVFNLDVGPPPQVVDVTLDPAGQLINKNVVFRGKASCSAPTTGQSVVIVELDQGVGRKAADYIGFAFITSCPGTNIPFDVVVEPQAGKVKQGPVTLQVIFSACNDFECGNKTIESMAGTVAKR